MGEPASDPVHDGFFREMAERYVEKTANKAVDKRPGMNGGKDKKGLNPLLLMGPVAANTFDAYSTQQAMNAGGREANPAIAPLAGNPAALYLGKAGIGAGTSLAAQLLAKSGHRNLGKIVAALGMALPVAAGIHNMQVAGQDR